MKIGILTYHNAVNYGAVLQAFALQESLGKIENVESFVIDYHSPAVDSQYKFIGYKESSSLKKFLLSNVTALLRLKKKKAFAEFVSSKLRCTKRVLCVSDDELEDIDTVVVGSDQVWNPSCSKGDKSYLLSNVSSQIKKISYAASMGSSDKIEEFDSKYGVDYHKFLKEFDAISCREKDASDYLTKELSLECEAVIDPVLLLERRDWIDFLEDSCAGKEEQGSYIFVYNLGNFPTLLSLVKKLSNRTGHKVVVINKDAKGEYLYRKFRSRSNVGPREFLCLLKNASYVVSDSFHATAFSILLEKRFYTVGNVHSDNTNTRMRNILSRYGLEQRYVIRDIDGLDFNEGLDFTMANEMLKKDRTFALEWLHTAVDNSGGKEQ